MLPRKDEMGEDECAVETEADDAVDGMGMGGGVGTGMGEADGLGAELITPGVGGALCAKHHCLTNAA